MGSPMFASAPTCDGQWYAMIVNLTGKITRVIPGVFASKAEADENARRYVGLRLSRR
jgi:hypothetical protein